MKALLTGILIALVFTSCASSQQDEISEEKYPDLVALNPPSDEQSSRPSKVYIDSVKKIVFEEDPALLIHGSFPDGCTRLESAEHKTHNDSLAINLTAWRDPDMMCSQALTPFSFIYSELSGSELKNRTSVTINGTSFNF